MASCRCRCRCRCVQRVRSCLFVDARHTEQVVLTSLTAHTRPIASQMQEVTTEISAYNHALETQSGNTRLQKMAHRSIVFTRRACTGATGRQMVAHACARVEFVVKHLPSLACSNWSNYLCYINNVFSLDKHTKNSHIHIFAYVSRQTPCSQPISKRRAART